MSIDPDLNIVMETLDEYRDKLPEGTYIRVCAAVKKLHNKLKRPKPRIKEILVPVIIATTLEIFKIVCSRT